MDSEEVPAIKIGHDPYARDILRTLWSMMLSLRHMLKVSRRCTHEQLLQARRALTPYVATPVPGCDWYRDQAAVGCLPVTHGACATPSGVGTTGGRAQGPTRMARILSLSMLMHARCGERVPLGRTTDRVTSLSLSRARVTRSYGAKCSAFPSGLNRAKGLRASSNTSAANLSTKASIVDGRSTKRRGQKVSRKG